MGPAVGRVDFPLGDVLDRAIDRQHHAVTGLGLLEHVLRRDLAAERVPAGDRLARHAGQIRVEGALDALEPALGALEAEHMGAQLTIRIEAERLREEPEPELAERPDLLGDRRRQLAPEPHEGARAGQRGVNLGLRQADDRRQARGDAHRVADAARLDEERLGRGRRRERAAQAVDNGSALRPEHDRARVLALRELGQLAVLDDHQPAETTGEAAERDGENRRQHQDPRPDGQILHWAGGLAVPSNAARLWTAARPVLPATYSFASRI